MLYTIGHSTRTLAEFLALLAEHGIRTLVDVRTVPRSRRVPQFNRETLPASLAEHGIAYLHLPVLGGLRRGLGAASPNTAWRNASFRAYADYMQTEEFAAGLEELIAIAEGTPTAIMCAEAVPWRCHRSLIADALVARGIPVCDIISPHRASRHELTPFARVVDRKVTYPGGEES